MGENQEIKSWYVLLRHHWNEKKTKKNSNKFYSAQIQSDCWNYSDFVSRYFLKKA